MTRQLYLGIDTSNYKTSVAAVDDAGDLVFEKSELLEVAEGKLGLRQSEAFYQHSMRLPAYISELFESVSPDEIEAIGYSSRPRRVEGSYMPCFNAGINAALLLSASLGKQAYPFSHQEGHAAAIIPTEEADRCIFMHLSGGTTEFLLCDPDDKGYKMELVGGTKDISFGQLLDRFGVALGLQFPAGRYLDDMAYECVPFSGKMVLPKVKLDDCYFNLSGAEAKLIGFAKTKEAQDMAEVKHVCIELFEYIADILLRSSEELIKKHGIDKAYMAGGVASSKTVRKIIELSDNKHIVFGDPKYSGDNAVGIAELTHRIHSICDR